VHAIWVKEGGGALMTTLKYYSVIETGQCSRLYMQRYRRRVEDYWMKLLIYLCVRNTWANDLSLFSIIECNAMQVKDCGGSLMKFLKHLCEKDWSRVQKQR